MNKNRHRLVFDTRRGMRVATAEHVRGSGKAGSGDSAAGPAGRPAAGVRLGAAGTLGLYALAPLWATSAPSLAQTQPIPKAAAVQMRTTLPVASTDAARMVGNFGSFNISTPSATQLRVDQTSNRAIINWDSFNVGAGNAVRFVQPDKGSTLNKIWSADPSVVAGRIQANGEVILQNTNGVIFAPTARVETGRFVATALRVAEEAYKTGLRGITQGTAAFEGLDNDRGGFVSLERGAEVRTAAGGDVLIFAPRVVNEGRIETPGGQTVLGAGRTVYMTASDDPTQRGLLVGIKPYAGQAGDSQLNTVTQGAAQTYKTVNGETVPDSTAATTAGLVEKVNAIVAERGSINLVAMAIRQNGLLQATTAVKGANGSIQLQAQADVELTNAFVAGGPALVAQTTRLGEVTLGPQSVTQVLPAADNSATQLDSETFNRSRVRVEGERIRVQSGAAVRAPSGSIEMLASDAPNQSLVFNPNGSASDHSRDESRIVVEAGAVLDVAGVKDVALAASRNQMSGRLFQIELADSPVQRNGVLYREEVFFDARKAPTVANVAGFYNTVARSANELSTTGGSISIQADGGVAVDSGAKLDISGGSVRYAAGTIKTSLVRQGNTWVSLDKADKAVRYDELGNSRARTETNTALWKTEDVAAYVEGKDAGTATIAGRRTYFAADVQAQAIVGPAQTGRTPSTNAAAPFAAFSGTATPKGGTLDFGRARVSDSSQDSATLQAADGAGPRPQALFEDPLQAPVDASLQPMLAVSSTALAQAGLGTLKFHVNNQFKVADGVRLELAPGGGFLAEGSSVDINGSLSSPGGRLEARTRLGDLTLGTQARLSTAGRWVDDNALQPAPAGGGATVAVNGGSVVLTSAGSLAAAPAAEVDVSAGAYRSGTAITRGRAGSVTLTLNDGALPTEPLVGRFDDWQATLKGHDFARGGSLSIAGLPSLTLGQRGSNDNLNDALFNDAGFGSISLSTLGDVNLAAGLNLQLQLKNLLPLETAGRVAAQGRFAAVATQPQASLRSPVSLSIQGSTATNAPTRVLGSSLTMAAGARIATEAGGSLRLTARRQLTVGGTLEAPGGSIALTLAGKRGGTETNGSFEDNAGFDPTQSLWLGNQARLSVAGTEELSLDRLGRPSGTVFGGGTITLAAERGYVVAQSGAVLDLRGHAADVLSTATGQVTRQSKGGGTLNIATPEGLHLAATLRAEAADAQADGGALNLALSLGGAERSTSGTAYPLGPRELRIVEAEPAALAATLAAGQNLSTALVNGLGQISNPLLKRAGFSQLELRADDRITFADNLSLSATRSLVLNSGTLAGLRETETALSAPYVALGDQRRTVRASYETTPVARSGAATLRVDAGLIDVVGELALDGFKFSTLNATMDKAGGQTRSDGEVRLVGTARGFDASASGSLRFAGELQFTGGQAYTTTLSTFQVQGLAGDSYFANYLPAAGSTSQAPLSAMGTLTLKADQVDLGGVLRQPFGRIEARAGTLNVGDGAELATSSEGLTVPLGTTVNGTQWQYRATGAFAADGSAKPVNPVGNPDIRVLQAVPVTKAVVLEGTRLSVSPNARIGAAGGGRLQAWEFVAGVGGSTDTLASAGLYAVLPTNRYEFAPFDPEIMSGAAAALKPGTQIDVTLAGSALEPGRYTLWPARYGTLPGAVMVSLASDQGRAPLTAALINDDGSTVVNGVFTSPGSRVNGDTAAPVRLRVEPAATALARSRIDLTSIDTLLARGADRLDLPTPALPSDGGRVSIQAQQPFVLNTAPDLGNRAGGRKGQLDVSTRGGRIAIVDNTSTPPAEVASGWTLVSATALANSQAGSVLVGGERSAAAGADGTVITPLASAVRLLASNTAVQAQEALLVARDEVTLGAGSTLRAEAAAAGTADSAPRSYTLQGDAAYALASNADELVVSRNYATGQARGATGRLNVADGATLDGNSIELGASADFLLQAAAKLLTSHLGLSANRFSLGSTPAAAVGTAVLDGTVLTQLGSLKTLTLSAAAGIDFTASQTLKLQRLTLDTPELRGLGGAASVVHLEAQELVLRNTSAAAASGSGSGSGRLEILATPVASELRTGGLTLGSEAPGAAAGSGVTRLAFDQAQLASSGDIVFSGTGALQAQKDATLAAARVTAKTGANHGLRADNGVLRIEKLDKAQTRGEQVGQGARLGFSAQRVVQAGVVQAPGGLLNFEARQADAAGVSALQFAAGSSTSAAGYTLQPTPGWKVYGGAGRISAKAGAGSIDVNGALDVSAPGTADAGSIQLQAANGAVTLGTSAQLQGQGGSAAVQGSMRVDTARLAAADGTVSALDRWAQTLNSGGFQDTVAVRQRSGDLVLDRATLKARQVELAADQGALALNGTIDARAEAGGQVRLFAGTDLRLEGTIDARSSRTGANGGDVTLGSDRGSVTLGAQARIDASGARETDGRIVLRAARDDDAGTWAVRTADGFNSSTQLAAGEIIVEAVRRYTGFSSLVTGFGSGAALGQARIDADQSQFLSLAADNFASSAWSQDARASLRAGVEVVSAGDFTVRDTWNLAQASGPGFLTLRAAGNLTVAGSISDGFDSATRPLADRLRTPTGLIDGPAWSMRLVAGADAAAADPLATRADQTDQAGDLTVANNQWVRTGAGSIDLAAGRDIRLGTGGANTQQGVVYVAGRPATQLGDLFLLGSDWAPQFTGQGGNLSLAAGRDIVGAAATQLSSAWFYHTGVQDQTAVGWWSAFDAFRQGVGSFGGGNVRVSAARDVRGLGVVAPTAALASEPLVGGAAEQTPGTVPRLENGGDISVQAGGDIRGGVYFLGRGNGRLAADGAVAAAPGFSSAVPAMGPLLALMDGKWTVSARGDAEVAGTYNPTLLPSANRGIDPRISNLDAGQYFTYGSTSSLAVNSQGGNLSLLSDRPVTSPATPGVNAYWNSLALNGPTIEQSEAAAGYTLAAVSVLPPSVALNALSGNVTIGLPGFSTGLTLFPSPTGQLTVHAAGNLNFNANAAQVALVVSDQRPEALPSTSNPAPAGDAGDALRTRSRAVDLTFDGLHASDTQPVRLHAGGDIDLGQGARTARVVLVFPKAAEITAGGDIRELSTIGQNNLAGDVTRIAAQGSVIQGSDTGSRITLAGPGRLELTAGRQLDLGASQGVETVGNLYRNALPAQGADLVLAAGTRATLDVDAFVSRYLTPAAGQPAAEVQAEQWADSYLAATGRNTATPDAATQALRAQLVQRFASQINLWGGADGEGANLRRAQLVNGVRQALGQAPLAPADAPAAYADALAQFKTLSAATQVAIADRMLTQLFAQQYLAPGRPYEQKWKTAAASSGVDAAAFDGPVFEGVRREVLFAELNVAGGLAAPVPSGSGDTRKRTYDIGFQALDLAGLGSSLRQVGDLDMVASGVQARNGGSITLLAPGGQINVGLPGTADANPLGLKGVVSYGQGGVSALAAGDFQVNSQRVFVVGQGDVTIWSSNGNIDAGRGANTSITLPPLTAVRQADGSISFTLPSLAVGSGIGILQPAVGQAQGDIGLYAPNGEVRALDAQIRAPGRITLAADVVRGADNISGGSVVGAPVVVPTIAFALPSAAPSAGEAQSASAAASGAAGSQQARERQSLLMVELLGLGLPADEENCNVGSTEEKAECDRRKKTRAEPSGPRTAPATRN